MTKDDPAARLLDMILPPDDMAAMARNPEFKAARNQEAAAFDIAEHLNTDALLIAYLSDFIGEDNPDLLRAAIETAILALAKRGNP